MVEVCRGRECELEVEMERKPGEDPVTFVKACGPCSSRFLWGTGQTNETKRLNHNHGHVAISPLPEAVTYFR